MYRLTSAALAAVVCLAAVSIASAQTTSPSSSPPASTSQGAPMPGANSFTEAQAKDRMEKAGFSQVNNLKKDDQGVWRASAMQSGKQVNVALDFQGNVVTAQ
jgi:hypothetical protein